MKKAFTILFLILFFIFSAFTDALPQSNVQVTKDKTLQYAKPKKPVKIRLHRNNKNEYSWDITGENVDDVIKADRRLRQILKEE
ncbi:MAG TPA: hypothetical protein PKZ17_07090 [Thermodesulfovibrio thiophilus]|uniref:hypothetical protein n=1 Tax=Thermodesulfovibrio thiophilus TaxID=340095 RepID=UPI001845977F|nr:hypothetical protein [Thermodesulfovibrio thiophilus]HHW19980.1 hypothetical protein [Thermodesulfovibrio thiophilus]HQA04481.1 hypothetical protein [Thermodesulfovibrio thiophilus]HQD36894.1 hypothetical protein [Thermodesulfovibrio thiophilus]